LGKLSRVLCFQYFLYTDMHQLRDLMHFFKWHMYFKLDLSLDA